MAVLAPIPRLMAVIAPKRKPGFFRKTLMAYRIVTTELKKNSRYKEESFNGTLFVDTAQRL
jgi:hypothetical protein